MAFPGNSASDSPSDASLIQQLQAKFAGTGAIISIAGPDGVGKTTLATQLVETFTEAGLPARRIHCYAWYKNIFVIPLRLARLKGRGEIIILDRSIFDNVIELARKAHLPDTILRAILSAVGTIHSRFDYRIALWAPLETLLSRRPEEPREKVARARDLYAALEGSADYEPFMSDGPILGDILSHIISHDPGPGGLKH